MVEGALLTRTVFQDGERYPLLLDTHGVPCWYPTLFVTTQLRNAAKAPNTITSVLSAIRLLLAWSQVDGVDLEARFAKREFLALYEIESLCRHLQAKVTRDRDSDVQIVSPVKSREIARARPQAVKKRVGVTTQYIRMTYVADYLEWLGYRLVEREARHVDADCRAAVQRMAKAIRARRPIKSAGSNRSSRIGMSSEQRNVLLRVVDPNGEENPFTQDVRSRNRLIVHLLDELGLRQGELLSIRISDINFTNDEIVIPRRHDDEADPRANQPVVKTMDRRLPLTPGLADEMSEYVMGPRRMIKPARRHEYLLVVHKSGPFFGEPLTARGLMKIFFNLRKASPEWLANLTPHILRHTWNDRFSEMVDTNGMDKAKEEKMRSYLMGWKEGSGTSAIYTQRHIEKEARKAALHLQGNSNGGGSERG